MRLLIVAAAAIWGVVSVLAFARTRDKTADAKLSAAYILFYPALAVATFLNAPVPLWLGVPVVFGFLPWFLAGPHLWKVLRDPGASRPDELIGIPRSYWAWGGLGALLLGLVFA